MEHVSDTIGNPCHNIQLDPPGLRDESPPPPKSNMLNISSMERIAKADTVVLWAGPANMGSPEILLVWRAAISLLQLRLRAGRFPSFFFSGLKKWIRRKTRHGNKMVWEWMAVAVTKTAFFKEEGSCVCCRVFGVVSGWNSSTRPFYFVSRP